MFQIIKEFYLNVPWLKFSETILWFWTTMCSECTLMRDNLLWLDNKRQLCSPELSLFFCEKATFCGAVVAFLLSPFCLTKFLVSFHVYDNWIVDWIKVNYPCCISVPMANQKLFGSVKSFWKTSPAVSSHGSGLAHS